MSEGRKSKAIKLKLVRVSYVRAAAHLHVPGRDRACTCSDLVPDQSFVIPNNGLSSLAVSLSPRLSALSASREFDIHSMLNARESCLLDTSAWTVISTFIGWCCLLVPTFHFLTKHQMQSSNTRSTAWNEPGARPVAQRFVALRFQNCLARARRCLGYIEHTQFLEDAGPSITLRRLHFS